MRLICILLLAVLLGACAPMKPKRDSMESCMTPSQVRSLSPDLNGATVEVCGYLAAEFENNNIYDTKRDADEYSTTKCLSVATPLNSSLSEFSGRFVRATGRFTSEFCPEGAICLASCSSDGIYLSELPELQR